ncbi:hypothetical protein ECZU24_59500 [Escherichia coli]|nr:hypothetical protein ECZU24_59500 [Escherichia coli]
MNPPPELQLKVAVQQRAAARLSQEEASAVNPSVNVSPGQQTHQPARHMTVQAFMPVTARKLNMPALAEPMSLPWASCRGRQPVRSLYQGAGTADTPAALTDQKQIDAATAYMKNTARPSAGRAPER